MLYFLSVWIGFAKKWLKLDLSHQICFLTLMFWHETNTLVVSMCIYQSNKIIQYDYQHIQ